MTQIRFAPLKDSQVDHWDISTDVAIVGFGGAGACAAIEAHDAGAKVLLMDAASAPGGSTALSSAEIYLGGGTRVQQACGYDDSVEAMYDYLMASNGPQADADKVRRYCEHAVEHFDWLVAQGVPFKDSELKARAVMATTDDGLLYTGSEKAWPYRDNIAPAPRGHNLQVWGDNGGPLFMKIMAQAIEDRGIEVSLETRALRLIVDADQRVVGVQIRRDMQELNVRAHRGVVLCAGGFAMNQAMLQKYAPDLLRCSMAIGNPGDTGGGIQMAMAVGASAINMHEGFVSLPFYPPASLTYGVLINSHGQRFINEDAYHGRVGSYLLRQDPGPIYFILSVEDYADYEKVAYLGAPVVATGETLEELLDELPMPRDAVAQTLQSYNEHAAQGSDPMFHKHADWLKPLEAPLVALDCTPGNGAYMPYFTLGGLETTPHGEVLNTLGSPIAGLYAAGRTACGVPRRGDGYASGISVGDATMSGRFAGRAAAVN
jgi:succinate dehydrogenase/fumarate reductase flavoprotein subunit